MQPTHDVAVCIDEAMGWLAQRLTTLLHSNYGGKTIFDMLVIEATPCFPALKQADIRCVVHYLIEDRLDRLIASNRCSPLKFGARIIPFPPTRERNHRSTG